MCKLDPPGKYTALIKSKSKCGLSENSRSVHECCNETVILLAVKGPNRLLKLLYFVFCVLSLTKTMYIVLFVVYLFMFRSSVFWLSIHKVRVIS